MGVDIREADLAGFARLRIPLELLAEAGVCRVTDAEARTEFGIRGGGDMSGIAFPYFAPEALMRGERRRNYVRIRRDRPEVEDGKEKKKYVAPYGDRKHLYFPPTPELFADVSVPIILVEAEKSALALTAWCVRTGRRFLPLAMGGCWGWKGKVGIKETASGDRIHETGAIPDLGICREGRVAYILLDANCCTNPKVHTARRELMRQVHKQGSEVKVLDLPASDGINGPDDFIALHGDEAMANIIDGCEDGSKLVEDLVSYYREYVRVGEDEYVALAVWVLKCHAFAAFSRTPYLNVTSPAPDCGKTQLLEVTELVVPEPMMASSCTAAVLSRSIDQDHPVLMVDEFDQLQSGDKDLLAAILATVNSGYKKSGRRYILEPTKGGGWQRKKLSTFCPKILSGISSLPTTTKTRCIPIHMERLAPGDHVSDPDEYIIEPQAAKLKAAARAWAEQHLEELTLARPDSPPTLRNRQREVSRPLFAIADAVGGKWPERVRLAVVRLFLTRDAAPADDIKTELLADIKEVFVDKDRMCSADLVQALVGMEDRPWATWGKGGKGINQNQLARLLKDFKIYPKTVRLDDGRRLKGYEREWFQPVWDRYLSHTDTQTVTALRPAKTLSETQVSNRDMEADVTYEKCEKTAQILNCHGVTKGKPETHVGGQQTAEFGDNGAEHHAFDCGAMTLAQARLRHGKSLSPELQEEFVRWTTNQNSSS